MIGSVIMFDHHVYLLCPDPSFLKTLPLERMELWKK
jgi:hypothetical protein